VNVCAEVSYGQSALRCLLTLHYIIDHVQKPSSVKCHSQCECSLFWVLLLLAGTLSANL
jgi:hypothetical protein